jgi:hypothetical protein
MCHGAAGKIQVERTGAERSISVLCHFAAPNHQDLPASTRPPVAGGHLENGRRDRGQTEERDSDSTAAAQATATSSCRSQSSQRATSAWPHSTNAWQAAREPTAGAPLERKRHRRDRRRLLGLRAAKLRPTSRP